MRSKLSTSTAFTPSKRVPLAAQSRDEPVPYSLPPITTKPWGSGIPQLRDEKPPTDEQRDSQLLFNEPKYIRHDDGDIHTLESNGLKMKEGVYY